MRIDSPIDEMDRRIIRLLQKNGRMPSTEIAREIAVTETTVRHRVNRLIDEGLIQIVAVPTPKAAESNVSAIVGLSVQPPHMQTIARAFGSCRRFATSACRSAATTSSSKRSSATRSTCSSSSR